VTESLQARLEAALSDRYRIERELGAGGMAIVYLAHDLRHDAKVAVKVLRPELAAAAGGQRFSREVRITAGLRHPNILPLLDSGEADGLPYYVMAYVEGESLATRLARDTRLPIDEAIRIAAEVADGLAHAHRAGFVHRDIKPDNILLSEGHAIIADFGIARAFDVTGADRLTDSGLTIGTPMYMSPEQAGGERLDGRSDIYSLAVVLYEALGGTPPFSGPSAMAVFARAAVDPVPSLRTIRRTVPPELEAAINTALAKAPEDRFSSAEAFRDEILRSATMPTSDVPTRQMAARRQRGRLAAVGVLAVLAVLVFVFLRDASPQLDANRVMVYPLVLPPEWSGPPSAGEDVATIIGSAMDGAGSLRWVDGWPLLDVAQREDVRLLDIDRAMAIARAQQCAFAVTGRLVSHGDSAEVFLVLYDVARGTVVARTAPGNTASLDQSWRAGMRAITEILPTLIPGRASEVEAEWRARPPQAVAHFLLGEAAFRRLQLSTAFTEYRAAVAADSTFGLAAVRGAQAAAWDHQSSEAVAMVEVAARGTLSPRHATFVEGLQAYLDGNADSAVARFHRTIALDSSMTAAWMQLGEVYIHLLPATGRTDSLADQALAAGRLLDSTSATLLFHPVEIAARRGEPERARRLARQFVAVATDTQLVHEVELVAACGPNGYPGTILRDAARRQPFALLLASRKLDMSPATDECALAGYEMLLAEDTSATPAAENRRFFNLLGRVGMLVARERFDEAIETIETFHQRWGYGLTTYLLAAPVAPELAERARAVATQDSATHGADYAGVPFPIRLWELGVWAGVEGRATVARAVAGELTRRATSGTRLDSLMAASVSAHATLAEGDSLGAVTQLSALVHRPAPRDDLAWIEPASLGYDRLVLGTLLSRRGEYEEAIDVLDVLDSAVPSIFPLYQRAALLARAEAAVSAGQAARAAGFRSRVAALTTAR
jgi:tetratricopeptide (TPR) repeat protein